MGYTPKKHLNFGARERPDRKHFFGVVQKKQKKKLSAFCKPMNFLLAPKAIQYMQEMFPRGSKSGAKSAFINECIFEKCKEFKASKRKGGEQK